MRKTALYIIAALLFVTSCNESLMEPQRMGSISLSLSSDVEVVAKAKADAVDCSNFRVDIYGTTILEQVYNKDYVYASMPESLAIPFGHYKVSAQNCAEQEAVEGFGKVRYYGVSDQIDVISYEPKSVKVQCRMTNGKATVTLDDSFLEDFSDITVELTSGTRNVSMSSEQANAPTEVYFNVPDEGASLIYRVTGTLAKGTENEKRLSYSNASSPLTLSPAKWAKITIKSNHNGILGPDITVDGTLDKDTTTEVIDPEQGSEVVDGTLGPVSIIVENKLDDATVVDCEIDIFK